MTPLLFLISCTNPTEQLVLAPLPDLPQKANVILVERGQETSTREAIITLVGEVRGEIEPCGCPTLPYGGFSRRAEFFKTLPTEFPTFHLDAGELLLKGFSGGTRDTSISRAELLLQLSREVGVDVMSVGPTDISTLGIEALQQYTGFPIISASYADANGVLLFPPVSVLEKKGFRLGIIGLGTIPSDPQYRESLVYIPPKEAIEKSLPLLPTNLDLIIALGSVDDEEAQSIATENLGIAAILTTRGAAFEESRNNTETTSLVIETPERGRYIHVLYLHLNTLPQSKLSVSTLEQPWRDRIMQQENAESIKKIEEEARGRNIVYLELNPLNESYDPKETTKTEEILHSFKEKRLAEAAKTAAQPTTEKEIGYASSGACSTCHSKEFAKWVYTKHADAWRALVVKNRHDNPECLQCHTTGFGEVGGLGELTESNLRRLKSVQCESCHGPLKGHPEASHVQAKPISINTCLPCHDEANSPNFDFSLYLAKATCQMD